jgi:hypothetical protein
MALHERKIMKTSRFGFLLAVSYVAGAVVYLGLVIAAAFDGGFPPVEPYQTLISVITYLFVPVQVLIWVSIHQLTRPEKHVFSLGSLALTIIFATLTSINRYNALTVLPQAKALGLTAGLEWFEPYGWPSIMAAMEVQAWGFYLGLALLCLAPVFDMGRLDKAIFWVLILSGVLCLLSSVGQVFNNAALNMLGIAAWGPGMIALTVLLAIWFKGK